MLKKSSQINENYNVIPSNNIDTIKTTDYIINGNDMSTENEKIFRNCLYKITKIIGAHYKENTKDTDCFSKSTKYIRR